MASDSIDFLAKYKDWNTARSIEITDKTDPKEVSAYLASVREEAARKAFEVLGLDLKPLDSYAAKVAASLPKKDYSSLSIVYKSLGSAETEPEISKATSGREELKPFAKAYLFRTAVQKAGLEWYISSDNKAFGKAAQQKPGKTSFNTDGISFMAKYKDWVSIKKLSIDANTKPEEVSAHLSSIRLATDRKTAQILGVDTDALDAYASEMTGNMRRSAANLQKVTQIMCDANTKKQLDAASNPSIREAAIIYLFGRMLQNIKIDLEVSPDTLMDMFPGLKIPKPKGRLPGQKKKKQ